MQHIFTSIMIFIYEMSFHLSLRSVNISVFFGNRNKVTFKTPYWLFLVSLKWNYMYTNNDDYLIIQIVFGYFVLFVWSLSFSQFFIVFWYRYKKAVKPRHSILHYVSICTHAKTIPHTISSTNYNADKDTYLMTIENTLYNN